MKKLISLILLATMPLAFALDSLTTWEVTNSDVSTNASPATTDVKTSGEITGYINSLALTVTTDYASPTVSVYVATSPSYGNGQETLIYTNASLTGSTFIDIRRQSVGTTGSGISGEYDRFPLYHDRLIFQAYGNNTTNDVSVRCVVYYEK